MPVRRRRAKKAGKAKAAQFEAWSYSRLREYESCPAKAKYKFLDKIPEGEPGRAMARGARIHELAEAYLNAQRAPKLPPELELFESEFKALRRAKATPESGFQFDASWTPLDEWFGDSVWCRVKTDAEYTKGKTCTIIDFKTGKQRPWHDEQLDLYALAGLLKYPRVGTVIAELWYTDQGDITSARYDRTDEEEMRSLWSKRVAPMMGDVIFRPTPSRNACQWCSFKKAKGGPCEF